MKAQSAEESLARIGRNRDEVLRQVDDLEKALNRDIIQALGLRYTDDAGLVSTEFEFDSDIFSGSINLLPTDPAADPVRFSPPFFEHGSVRIEPIDAFFTRWATLVVFRVGQMRSAGRLRLEWDAHEDGARNPIFLVDEENGQYCYPTASSMTGVVLPGHPRIGIIAFELFRKATSRFSIHFSDVPLGQEPESWATFSFSCADEEMDLDSVIHGSSLRHEVSATLDQESARVRSEIQMGRSGCMLAGLAFLVALGLGGGRVG